MVEYVMEVSGAVNTISAEGETSIGQSPDMMQSSWSGAATAANNYNAAISPEYPDVGAIVDALVIISNKNGYKHIS